VVTCDVPLGGFILFNNLTVHRRYPALLSLSPTDELYPVYMIEQTSSKRRANIKQAWWNLALAQM